MGGSRASHPLGGGDAHQGQGAGQGCPAGSHQLQPRLGQRLVVGDHAALLVEVVEDGGQLDRVVGQVVRLWMSTTE